MHPLTPAIVGAPVQHCLHAFNSSSSFTVSGLVTLDTQTFVVALHTLEAALAGIPAASAEKQLKFKHPKTIIETNDFLNTFPP